MLQDGLNVKLSDELKMRLLMTTDENLDMNQSQEVADPEAITTERENLMARKKNDPTFGMTADQKARYKKKLANKPRPRDLFDVESLIKRREARIIDRKLKQ